MDASELGGSPGSLGELTERTDLVVVGEVVAVQPGRVMFAPEDEPEEQVLDVIVSVKEVLSGETPTRSIVIEMDGWEIADDGTAGRLIIVNGVSPPAVGDEMVWFVNKQDGMVDSAQRYGLASYDGIYFVNDGVLSSTVDGQESLGQRTTGMTLEELSAAIAP